MCVGETLQPHRDLPGHRRSHTLAIPMGTTPAAEIHIRQVAEPQKEKATQRNTPRASQDPSAARSAEKEAPLSSSG